MLFCEINSFLKRKHTVCRTSEMTHELAVLLVGLRGIQYSLWDMSPAEKSSVSFVKSLFFSASSATVAAVKFFPD
jgi:hypothetical protein